MSSYDIDHEFERMLQPFNKGEIGQFSRTSYWMNVGDDPVQAEPYRVALDLWSTMITDDGQLTDGGFVAANRLQQPGIDEFFAETYDLDAKTAEAVVSRAFWDLLFIRRAPTTKEINH